MMADLEVGRVTTDEELEDACAKLELLNRKRLRTPLDFQEERARQAYDRGIQYYLLVKRTAKDRGLGVNGLKMLDSALSGIFHGETDTSDSIFEIRARLAHYGVEITRISLNYNPESIKAYFKTFNI